MDSLGKTVEETVDAAVEGLETIEAKAKPIRDSVLKRFPVLFIFLTTFGLTAVFFGFERMLAQSSFLYERPWLILFLGVLTLALTGNLYKKLGQ